jgi:hypothetical protein
LEMPRPTRSTPDPRGSGCRSSTPVSPAGPRRLSPRRRS